MSCRRRTYSGSKPRGRGFNEVYGLFELYHETDRKYMTTIFKLDESTDQFIEVLKLSSYEDSDSSYFYCPLGARYYNNKIEISLYYGGPFTSYRFKRLIYDCQSNTYTEVSECPSGSSSSYGYALIGDRTESGDQFYGIWPSGIDYRYKEGDLYVSHDEGMTLELLANGVDFKDTLWNLMKSISEDYYDIGIVYDILEFNGYYFFFVGNRYDGLAGSHSSYGNDSIIFKVPISSVNNSVDFLNSIQIVSSLPDSYNNRGYSVCTNNHYPARETTVDLGLDETGNVYIPLYYETSSDRRPSFISQASLKSSDNSNNFTISDSLTYDGSTGAFKYYEHTTNLIYYCNYYNGSYPETKLYYKNGDTKILPYDIIENIDGSLWNRGSYSFYKLMNDRCWNGYGASNNLNQLWYYDLSNDKYKYCTLENGDEGTKYVSSYILVGTY